MSRNPRLGVGLTKTEQLRQAKSAALARELEQKHHAAMKQQADPFRKRKRVTMPEPKRVDFSKPGMTKAMMARVKQAEKFKQEYERKQEAIMSDRRPKRTPAPIGGDARMGRERVPGKGGRRTPRASPTTSPMKTPVSRRESEAGPSHLPTARRDLSSRFARTPEQAIPKKTNELAKMMNADVVQAEPVGEGPVSNIVIPPGMVSQDRTTIVTIQPPHVEVEARAPSQIANRSIQVISETLDQQDAAEAAAVQNKLTDLQQARRDFVIAVANVGGNAVNIEDESIPSGLSDFPGSPLHERTPPDLHYRPLYKVPDLEDEYLKIEYGRDHPDILAAREFIQKSIADMEHREAAKRMEEEFERIAAKEQMTEDLNLEVPFEDELYQDRDISWEEDEETGMAMPRPSRVKAYLPPVPEKSETYQHKSFDPEELERFFDVKRYPPCPRCGPPPGREQLHPDLWEMDDPWYRPPSQPDMPDLMEFDLMDFE